MDSRLEQPQTSLQQLGAIALAALLLAGAVSLGIYFEELTNPYIRSVLSHQGDSTRGWEIFRINCAGCHGLQAGGIVGPNLHGLSHRRSKSSIIHQVIDGKTPPMPQFQPGPQAMADLLSYLETL